MPEMMKAIKTAATDRKSTRLNSSHVSPTRRSSDLFRANIPKAHAESQATAKTDEQERGGFDDNIRKSAPGAERGFEEVRIDLERVGTGCREDDARNDESH